MTMDVQKIVALAVKYEGMKHRQIPSGGNQGRARLPSCGRSSEPGFLMSDPMCP